MCVFNQNDGEKSIDLAHYSERVKDFKNALDVATGTTFSLGSKVTLGGKYVLVMKLLK